MQNALVAALTLAALLLSQAAPVLAAGRQIPLDLVSQLNFILPTNAVPTGGVTWAGVNYRLDSRVFRTRDAALSWYPEELSLSVPGEARHATAVHILINLEGEPGEFTGQKVGELVLSGSSGGQQSVDLVAGVNVRGWLLADSATPLTDPNTKEVYRGPDSYGRTAVIDSLTVPVDPSLSASGLARISIRDTSFETANSLDPGLIIRAVTVDTE